jgi:hypothetical protein
MNPSRFALDMLLSAYLPCAGFAASCTTMRWNPTGGHVPRGFCGATDGPERVRLVLICAEPGDPHDGEHHAADGTEEGHLRSTYAYTWHCLATGKDQFHRNIRWLLHECWPGETFEQHMQKTWVTDSVLCSAEREMGKVPLEVERACTERHLRRQLAALPDAVVVALGGKAQARLRRAGVDAFHPAFAVAPPGCNMPGARESWQRVAALLHGHRS